MSEVSPPLQSAQPVGPQSDTTDMPDWRTFTILCGIPGLEPALIHHLEALGLRLDQAATTLLLFDVPCGFALRLLPTLDHTSIHVIVITETSCPEYWEDVWDLQPASLLVGMQLDQTLFEPLVQVSRGERYRRTPDRLSSLSSVERVMLHALACGWSNRRIAEHIQLEEKTVRNALTTIYAKLQVTNRVEATLYYWGQDDLCARTTGQRLKKLSEKEGRMSRAFG